MKVINPVFRGVTCADSALFAGKETNDCTVRALASASKMPYEDAHILLNKHGRKNHIGASFRSMMNAYLEAGFELKSVHGTTQNAKWVARHTNMFACEGITLAKILPKLGKGSYILNVTGHAVAVVDGNLIDTFPNPVGKRVIAVFKKIEKPAE